MKAKTMAMISIPLPGKTSIEIDEDLINDLPVEAFRKLVLRGLKEYLKAGMSGEGYKTGGLEDRDLEKAQEAIQEKAAANWAAIQQNKFGERGLGAAKKVPGAVKTRAMQKARQLLKDAVRREGYKVSAYKAAEYTEWAKQYLEEHPEIIEEAAAELQALEKKSKAEITLPSSFKREDAKAKPKVPPKPPTRQRKEAGAAVARR